MFASIHFPSRGELTIMFCLLLICWHSHTETLVFFGCFLGCCFFLLTALTGGHSLPLLLLVTNHLFFTSKHARLTTSLKAQTSCFQLPPLRPTAVCSSPQGYVIRQRVAAVPLNASLYQPQPLPKSKNAIKS